MRKQFHFRPSPNGFYAWDVHRLVKLATSLPVITRTLDEIAELDEAYWFYTGDTPTCRNLAEHFKLMMEADLEYPIILCSEGRVMDGMHRATKSLTLGKTEILCVQFEDTPKADFLDVQPADIF
ncbi:MAG: hypothetical protein AAF950_03045 [Pseudomonadota bacterium]